MNTKLKFAGVALAVALIAGCAGNGGAQGGSTGSGAPQFSGFLADYSKLKPVAGIDGTLRYIDTSANLRPYNKVMIDPVQVFTNPSIRSANGWIGLFCPVRPSPLSSPVKLYDPLRPLAEMYQNWFWRNCAPNRTLCRPFTQVVTLLNPAGW